MRIYRFFIVIFILTGCTGLPDDVQPVKEFDLNRYQGKWYEIARLDHSFERGMSNVTATYSLRKDGGVKVVNKGYLSENNKWKEAEGKAYLARNENEGYLKVSFFGPFYGTYAVFELDKEQYQYAFVSSYNKSYLWLLSRSPSVSRKLIDRFISRSKELGFNTDNLIFVNHDLHN
jgi:apolipoprotein D and lipocalin family protein